MSTPGKAITKRIDAALEQPERGDLVTNLILISLLAVGAISLGALLVGKAQEWFSKIG